MGSPLPVSTNRTGKLIVIAAGLALLGSRAQAQAGARDSTVAVSLTRREAVDRALLHNPQLRAGREQTAQAGARRVQAISIPDPTFSAIRDEHADYPAVSTTLTAGLTVAFPDKLRLRYNAAQAAVRSSESGYTLLRQQIVAQTAAGYDTFLVALRHRGDLEENRKLAQDFLRRTQARFDAGAVPRLDVIKAQVDLAQAETQFIANERDLIAATASLNRLMGQPVSTPLQPRDTLVVPPPLPALATLVPIALALRPELRSSESQIAGARANTALARESWLPDLVLGAVRDNVQSPSPQYWFGISMPVPLFFWQYTAGTVAEARHHVLELVASNADLRAQVEQDLRTTYATANSALRQVTYIRDQLLPSAREAFRVATVSYGLGGASALEVLDARRTLLDAESAYADALGQANSARADLERAVGAPLESATAR